jgi:hypothetical protein
VAKIPSDKLFRFIHTLTPAEKRYFRLFVRGKADRSSKYLQLFDAMDAQQKFDEEALKRLVYEGAPVEGKKYSELKAYLYDMLLKSLQAFDEQQAVEYRLNNLLEGVSVLFKRGLYDDCRDLLHKASKTVIQYECFTHRLEIIRWEKQLAYTQMDVDFLHRQLEKLEFEENRTLEQLQNLSAYRQAFFQVYTTIKREAQYRGDDRLLRLQTLVNREVFADPDKALSHKARVLYYRTLNLYHYTALDYEQFYLSGQNLIYLIESQPHFLKENISDYIAALSNLILSCGLLQRYDEVRVSLHKLRSLKPITEDDRRKIHRQYYTNSFALNTFTGDFQEDEALHFDPHDYETASFFFQYACICFGCDDFDRALDYLNQWLGQPRTVEREDLQSVARILSLIIHFEMGNWILLESLMRSATRFLQKKNRLFDLERRFIQYMSEYMRQSGVREQRAVFEKMRVALQELSKTPETQALLQTFDFGAWLDAKIQGSTFAVEVHRKWQRTITSDRG